VNVFDDIQFYLFNHHHYTVIPKDEARYASTWVDYPNSLFDAQVGHDLYARYMREILLAEELGFDAVAVNEHHATTYSMMPSTSVRAAWVASQTTRMKVLVSGVPINLSWPSRVAEEYAMLDVMSGGRMEFGFPLGTGMEYWSNAAAINPAKARDRFREGLDIILRAWTEDGPLRYEGEHFLYRYLNVWPKTFQKPHPKIYIVGSGSPETVQLAADYGTGYSVVFTPIAQQLKAFQSMRDRCAEKGREVQPEDVLITVIGYVGDTDEQAMREARPYIERFFTFFHRTPPKRMTPPGYVSTENYKRLVGSAALADSDKAAWEDMLSIGRIACGSPETVAALLTQWAEEAGTSRIIMTLNIADMPEQMVRDNMTRFATEVIPLVRANASISVTEQAGVGAEAL
jgi:alkanesulfonate monooxygenase SsuD/methylene tetrahydromethanopterin reductase-like flavin-dependent oxidoreductase (luciferase family)